jgi:hypothetical protein
VLPSTDAHTALRIHTETVERVNRHGYKTAYRGEEARRRRRERTAAQPARRSPRILLLQGLRRLRFA